MEEWRENSLVSKDTIKQYKSEWKKHGFPDVDLKWNSRSGIKDWNEPNSQPTAEQLMWACLLSETVADWQKTSALWKKPCHDCHSDQPCGHVKTLVGKNDRFGVPRVSYAGRPSTWNKCPYFHNYQQCAEAWLRSPDCEDVCNFLNINVDYFRRKIGMRF